MPLVVLAVALLFVTFDEVELVTLDVELDLVPFDVVLVAFEGVV